MKEIRLQDVQDGMTERDVFQSLKEREFDLETFLWDCKNTYVEQFPRKYLKKQIMKEYRISNYTATKVIAMIEAVYGQIPEKFLKNNKEMFAN